MGVRAVWHTELVLDEGGDPFAEPGSRQIEDVGTPIALGAVGDEAALQDTLIASLMREGELEAQGVTCAIKAAADTSCHACPLYIADGSPAAQLCAIGRQQEQLCTQMVVVHRGGRR